MIEFIKNTGTIRIQNISNTIGKRLMDIVLAVLILPFACGVSVVFAFVFWIATKENPFFAQTRVGMNQQPFRLFKLRTMRGNTKDLPTHEISRENIPKVGRVMRALKVDELPQVFNVLKGNMSFVGPRPCLLSQQDLIKKREQLGVFSIKPGITGLAQIQGIDMSQPTVLAQEDQRYLMSNSLMGDVSLILQTILGKGRGDKTAQ